MVSLCVTSLWRCHMAARTRKKTRLKLQTVGLVEHIPFVIENTCLRITAYKAVFIQSRFLDTIAFQIDITLRITVHLRIVVARLGQNVNVRLSVYLSVYL